MKNISTLVKDIYALLETGKAKLDGDRLGKSIAKSLEASKGGDALRMSTLGEKCVRKLWFRQNQPETAEPIEGHTLVKFTTGHILEDTVLELAQQAGHDVQGRQTELHLFGVRGHRDAIIDGVLVDVKSANSRSIHKFARHRLESDDPFGYLDQLDAYLAGSQDDPALKVRGEAAFLAVDKELGHLYLDTYKMPKKPWENIIAGIRSVLKEANPPPRAYHPKPHNKDGSMKLPMECSYCQYKSECWKDVNNGIGLKKYIYSYGPVWLTKIVKEPNVPRE